MKISTRSRYGLRLLIELAKHTDGKPVFLNEIARRTTPAAVRPPRLAWRGGYGAVSRRR
ncbi:MAG: Rrf2 family transcriptional regulator [Deltaproteobacteria bacterium]|nr:Rrf2 family transcriptional regulator [Deltaproteobacteria bacterium]